MRNEHIAPEDILNLGHTERTRIRNRRKYDLSAEDLEAACKALRLAGTYEISTIGAAPDPMVKADNNGLGVKSRKIINDCMKYDSEVSNFIQTKEIDEDGFAERLRQSFVSVYDELAGRDIRPVIGDDLFESLIDTIMQRAKCEIHERTIKAILTYFFVRCEVFPFTPGTSENVHDSSN